MCNLVNSVDDVFCFRKEEEEEEVGSTVLVKGFSGEVWHWKLARPV